MVGTNENVLSLWGSRQVSVQTRVSGSENWDPLNRSFGSKLAMRGNR